MRMANIAGAFSAAQAPQPQNALGQIAAQAPGGADIFGSLLAAAQQQGKQYNALAEHGGPTNAAAAAAMGGASGGDWLKYNNQGATRNKPLSDKLVSAMSFLPELGVEMRVFSGGQAEKGSGGPRTGSTRHDHGHAADADFYVGGRKLDWNNPQDVPIFQEIVRRAKAAGVTGIGAGDDYMGAGRMHIGFGAPAVWGAVGKGSNAPAWLRQAYHGG
jgi:hypothetical protein